MPAGAGCICTQLLASVVICFAQEPAALDSHVAWRIGISCLLVLGMSSPSSLHQCLFALRHSKEVKLTLQELDERELEESRRRRREGGRDDDE